MLKLTFKNIWAHKMRLVLSMLSIFLGVAFLSGTLVFTSTIKQSFNDLFTSVYKKTDAVVTGHVPKASAFDDVQKVENVPKSLVDVIGTLPSVREVEGSNNNYNEGTLVVIDKEGNRVFPRQGPPTFAISQPRSALLTQWILVGKDDENLSAKETVSVNLADNEVLVDKATAFAHDFKIGKTVKIVTDTDVRSFTVKGYMRFGTADGFGGTANFFFNDKQAGEILKQTDSFASISVAAKPGVTQEELKKDIDKTLKAGYAQKFDVKTGQELIEESQDIVDTIFTFFTYFLLVFAAISFLVALIIIINSFAIIMTQRKREYALLRAIGATGGQILRSVIGESLVVGFIASTFGVVGGIGIAAGIKEILKAANFKLPAGPLVIPTSSITLGIIVGTVATFISAFFPAFNAARTAPIEALRDSAYEKNKRMFLRICFSVFLILVALALIFAGYQKSKDDTGQGLQIVGAGIVILLLFVVIALPIFIKPFTKVVGSKVAGVLLVVFGGRRAFGITGEIARRNNYRNPRRSAKTSLALMIGVALVVFITVFVSSTTASFNSYLKQTYSADIIIGGFDPGDTQLSQSRCDEIDSQSFNKASSCLQAAGLDFYSSKTKFEKKQVFAVNSENLDKLFTLKYSGEVNGLGESGMIVSKDVAENENLKVGSSTSLSGSKGKQEFKITGILEDGILGPGGDTIVIDSLALNKIEAPQNAFLSLVVLKSDVEPKTAKVAFDKILKNTGIEVNDLKTIRQQQQDSLNSVLIFVYGILALAIIIASIGILNTMSLSILERRRELGLMRAVGTTKAQVRGFVRFESIILSVLGTAVGIVFGIGSGYILIKSLKSEGFTSFSVNPVSMLVIVFISAFIGSVAGAWPAWRATKVDVLKAITVE